ncbi:hypothetical protein MSC49_05710 [Methylosinus sp. C49]|uniref:DUF4424 family protein n=1 Tax=Methylosinus sp. C49 TaxID=2699395 RepID=UPI001366CA59|nr:DUF4424 family protein [Methylosinus sp. C49]BBU60636.1 hypothetical protein MSC49_05710 [Methylosinus sp. C49]
MSLLFPRGAGLAAAILALGLWGARAEETLQELVHRGPELAGLEAAGLVVEQMELTLGAQNSSLKYRIVNPTAAPARTNVTFPLPEIDFSDPDAAWSIPGADPVNYIGLAATVDQKPAPLAVTQSAFVDGKDVTAALRRSGLPLVPIGFFHDKLAALTADARARLVKDRLIAENGVDQAGNPIYAPRWSVRGAATRTLDLAPGQGALLDFRFRSSVGVARDSVLREPLRSSKELAAEVERRRADYCLDRAFLAGVDKMVSAAAARRSAAQEAAALPPEEALAADTPKKPQPVVRIFPEANVAELQERHIAFDLGAGAPAAPVRQFRLVVDKGKPTRLVSFCLADLKKISPTAFEMRAADFRPTGLLRVLLLGPKD